jgi:ferric-dicitrate binding protein FerR (iron transport regulator)
MSDADRFDLLLEQYLDGAIAEAARTELLARLRERPDLRKRFCAALAMETALRLPRRETAAAASSASVAVPARRPTAARPAWRLAAAAAALLSLAGAAWWLAGGGPSAADAPALRIARVDRVEAGGPPPAVAREGAGRATATAGLALGAGDRLETGGGAVTLRYDGEATVLVVQPRARAACRAESGAKRIDLDAGALRADVAPQPAGRPMRLATPHGTATVVGTRFELMAGAKETTLHVERGAVELAGRSGAGRLRVETGQRARTDGASAPARLADPAPTPRPPPAAPPRWHLDLDAVRTSGAAGWTGIADAGGLAPAFDTEWAGPPKAWLAVSPPPPQGPGLVRVAPGLRATMLLSLDRPREVALMLLVRPPDRPEVWTANLQANRRLPAGSRQAVTLAWDDFRAAQGSEKNAAAGQSVYQIFLMTWGDDPGGLRLHALEIGHATE